MASMTKNEMAKLLSKGANGTASETQAQAEARWERWFMGRAKAELAARIEVTNAKAGV